MGGTQVKPSGMKRGLGPTGQAGRERSAGQRWPFPGRASTPRLRFLQGGASQAPTPRAALPCLPSPAFPPELAGGGAGGQGISVR